MPTWPRWSCIGTVGTVHTPEASAGRETKPTKLEWLWTAHGLLGTPVTPSQPPTGAYTPARVFKFREMRKLFKLLHFRENHQILYVAAKIVKRANYFTMPRAFTPVADRDPAIFVIDLQVCLLLFEGQGTFT